MSYQVLARKLRPATFAELVGQDHVVRALTHALDNDRLHHAYLFTGTRGVGKTTIARILAKSLNCEKGVSSTPCGECSICREISENRFIDLIEVDAASRTRVDDTRELLDNAQYLPSRGRYKVYLIDEVHMLSASSFNALLKTLEEPPSHIKFLLATTDPRKVPVTVLSRCLQFQLKNLSSERIADYLSGALDADQVTYEPLALSRIAAAARGSMRDALSITDQAIGYGQGQLSEQDVADMLGLVGRDEVGGLIEALAGGSAGKVLSVTAELADRGVDFQECLAELLAELHRMAVDHALAKDVQAIPFDAETVQLYYQIALMGYRDLEIAPDSRSGAEMTLLRMLTFSVDGSRVPRLEPSADDQNPKREAKENNAPKPKSKTKKTNAKETQATAKATTQATKKAITKETKKESKSSEAQKDNEAPKELEEHEKANEREKTTTGMQPGPRAEDPSQTGWYELVAELPLTGVARMITEYSQLVRLTEHEAALLLDASHDMLLNDAQHQTIQRALTDKLGRDIRLTIDTGSITVETPAMRNLRLAEERQQDAQRTLESDETVRSLLSEFGGRLDGVRAVETDSQATHHRSE